MFKNAYEKLLDITGPYLPLAVLIVGLSVGWVAGVSNLIWYYGDYNADAFGVIATIVSVVSLVLVLLVKEGRVVRSREKESAQNKKDTVLRVLAFAKARDERIRQALMSKGWKNMPRATRFSPEGMALGQTTIGITVDLYKGLDAEALGLMRMAAEDATNSVIKAVVEALEPEQQ